MRKITWRTPGNYDQDKVSEETGIICLKEEDRAQQQFLKDTDINELVKRFGMTGEFPQARQIAEYMDLTDVPIDFHDLMNRARKGQEAFESLPANVRDYFRNDVGNFIDFIQDEENYTEGVRLGIYSEAPESPSEGDRPAAPVPPTPAPDNAA
jgi:phage internal scaffolding protein